MGIEQTARRTRNRLPPESRNWDIVASLKANDMALSRSNCRLAPPRQFRNCNDSHMIDHLGHGFTPETHDFEEYPHYTRMREA
jgi:hypothetical protein